MKRKTKQIIIITIVFLLGLGLLSPLFALTDSQFEEFQSNEKHYENLCQNYGSDDAGTCQNFKKYKEEKISRAKEDIKDAKSTLKDLDGKIEDEEEKFESYEEEIEILKVEIKDNEKSIEKTEVSIEKTEKEIEERKKHIKELNELVAEFLVNMQGEMRVNGYIEFLMGASDFSDIVRRSEGMKRIKEYNEEIINEVKEEQDKLEEDRKLLVRQKQQLDQEKELLKVQKEKAEALQEVVEEVIAELKEKYKDAEKLVEQSVQISKSEEKRLNDIIEKIEPPAPAPSTPGNSGDSGSSGSTGGGGPQTGGHASSGWQYPISGSFGYGPGVWGYPWGGRHLGQDFTAPIGSSLVAPANGIVVRTQGGCPSYGGLGSNCNGGWGNNMNLIVNVGDKYYGLMYAHIQQGGFTSSVGQQVSAGQRVALSGSSGRSSGPHLHVEVYYLGNQGYAAAMNYLTTNTFGTGSSWSANEYNYRCTTNGNSAPCRMNPSSVFP